MREVGEKSGEGRGGNEGVGKGNARKKLHKNATYLAFGDAFWGLPLRVIHFLSRDAMQARAMSSCGVCPSVTFVHMYSIKRNKDIVKKFSPSGCHTILVFAHQTPWQYSNGDLLTGGVKCRWGRQKSRFWANFIACCEPFDRQVQYTQLRRTMDSWRH